MTAVARSEQTYYGELGIASSDAWLSAVLNDFASAEQALCDSNLAIPILMAHGSYDQVIPISRAATSRENLIRLGFDVRWFDYPMEHQVCLEEITEISAFFQEVL